MIVLQPRTRREVSYDANPTEWKQTGLPVLWAEHLAQSRYHDSEHDEDKIIRPHTNFKACEKKKLSESASQITAKLTNLVQKKKKKKFSFLCHFSLASHLFVRVVVALGTRTGNLPP